MKGMLPYENLKIGARIKKVPRKDIWILRLACCGSRIYYGTSNGAACREGF